MISREHLEQLVLALTLERRQAQDLAGAQLERDPVDLVTSDQVAGFEHDGAIGGVWWFRNRRPLLDCRFRNLPEHGRDEACFPTLAGRKRLDITPVPQDRCFIADLEDLAEAM